MWFRSSSTLQMVILWLSPLFLISTRKKLRRMRSMVVAFRELSSSGAIGAYQILSSGTRLVPRNAFRASQHQSDISCQHRKRRKESLHSQYRQAGERIQRPVCGFVRADFAKQHRSLQESKSESAAREAAWQVVPENPVVSWNSP